MVTWTMTNNEELADIIKKDLDVRASNGTYERMRSMILGTPEHTEQTVPANPLIRIRRRLMKNPIAKLAVAAAVVAAILIGLALFSNSGSGVVWAEVLEKTEQISAVVYDMTAEIDETQQQLVLPSKNYVAGNYGTRSDIFMDGKLMAIKYRLPSKKVAYQIRVDRKQYWRFDLSNEEAAMGRDPDDPRTWLKMILSGEYTKLGRSTIDGVVAEGIECHRPEFVGEDGVMRLWVGVETNLPVRIEAEMEGMEGGRMKPQKFVMENFDWNAQLDESFFEPNIPDDYTPGEDPRAAQAQQGDSKTEPAASEPLTDEERAALPEIKQTVTLFLQACGDRNWDEMLKYGPGLAKLTAEQREAIDTHCGGLEIMQMGEPFKTGEPGLWKVPCQVKWKARGTGHKEIRVRYDETLGKFTIAGGL